MTVYLVTSFHRSGSSMMMRCLEAGGMQAVYDDAQDFMNVTHERDGYQPNPNGFYAMSGNEFKRPDFAQEYDGMLVKIPAGDAFMLPPGDYRILFMWREPVEILKSMATFTPFNTFTYESVIHFYDQAVTAFVARTGAEIVRYSDVLNDPFSTFAALTSDGWPIDAAKAATCVDPALYRSVHHD